MDRGQVAGVGLEVSDGRIPGPAGEIFFRRWQPPDGRRLPLILLHDSLGCVELWRDFPAALAFATGRPVLAYDRLGFGRSATHPGRLDLEFIAGEATGDFAALCEALDLGPFHVFGHSVGGGMAVNIAARFPDHCRGLITESAQAFVEDRTRAGLLEAQDLFADPRQLDRLRRYHGDKAPWVLSAWLDTWLHPEFAAWSLDAVLPQVRCPALIMHGEADEYGTPAHPQRLQAGLGGAADMVVLAGIRHVPHREDEAGIVRQVSDFLARLP